MCLLQIILVMHYGKVAVVKSRSDLPTTWSLHKHGGACWYQYPVGTRCQEGGNGLVFLWWPYFFFFNDLGFSPSSSPSFPCFPLLFFFFLLLSRSLLPSKGWADSLSIHISLLSVVIFFVLVFAVLAWGNHLNLFIFIFLLTWILGKTSSWKIWGLYHAHLWVCGSKLFCFVTALNF